MEPRAVASRMGSSHCSPQFPYHRRAGVGEGPGPDPKALSLHILDLPPGDPEALATWEPAQASSPVPVVTCVCLPGTLSFSPASQCAPGPR